MLTYERGRWYLEGRPLRDGDFVEMHDPVQRQWVPGSIVGEVAAVEPQGTADSDHGHRGADFGLCTTLRKIAGDGIGLRRARR